MPNVVIVGGGLSGLASAFELERLGVQYTLIEVKSRLGGSIVTVEQDDFIVDGGLFLFPRNADWDFLADLKLNS